MVNSGRADVIKTENTSQTEQVNVGCTSNLQGLTNEWASDYLIQHPGAEVNVSLIAEPGTNLPSSGQLVFVSGNELSDQSSWKMAVGREVIVPVFNSTNPFVRVIAKNGVTRDRFSQIFREPSGMVWGTVAGNGETNPVHLYLMNDQTVTHAVRLFLGMDIPAGNVIYLDNYENFRLAIQNDPYAIGFCRLSGLVDPAINKMPENIQIMPIDKNANGKLDYMENVYGDVEAFSRGVWIGKYPKELINEIYAVASTQPVDEAQTAFLTWVLTEGQGSLVKSGISELVYSEIQSKLDKFDEAGEIVPVASKSVSIKNLILFIIAGTLLLGIMSGAIFGFGRSKKGNVLIEPYETDENFDERTVTAPAGLYYDKSHTWAFMEKDGTVKVGIDDFMQHITGPITRVEMKKPGEKITKGELFLSLVQKGKQLKLYAPVTGTILECNDSLESNGFMLNTAPYSEGWVYRLEPTNWMKEIPLLSMAGKYTKWLSGEFNRLKEFLAFSSNTHKLEYFQVVLQDGGALRNNLLEDFGPEVWEDFQSKFIDKNI
jgi:glycine cleavage system H lipoate-binding protein/ABC-type phosphate transport system substrate-binding protein